MSLDVKNGQYVPYVKGQKNTNMDIIYMLDESVDLVELDGLDIYEFGVYSGNTMNITTRRFRENGISFRKIFGFDSFEGLPEEAPGIAIHPNWHKGAFCAKDDYGNGSVDSAIQNIYGRIEEKEKLTLIPGWFSDTCNKETINKYDLGKSSYIHIDCDIYLSAFQALDFLFKYKIPLQKTIIRFDDYSGTDEKGGEKLALSQITQKYCIKSERLAHNLFKVISYD